MFQHDTRHTGCSPYVGPQTANLKWTFSLDNKKDYIYTMSPAIAGDGTLYVGGYNGSNILHAVNPDGTEKWPLWSGDMDYTPAIGSDGTIYLNQYSAGNYNRLVAYRPDSTSKYVYNIGSAHGMTCSPAIGPDNTLYFTTDAGYILYAVRDSGSSLDEIWKFTAAYPFKWQSPALATSGPNSGTIYISAGNYLYAIYSSTGIKKWDLDLVSAGTYTTPAVGADGTIYINDGHGSLVAITDKGPAGGVIKWDYNIAGNGLASPAIGQDGTIYIGNNNTSSIFWAINDKGTYADVKWQRDGLGAADASAVIGADSTVYYQTRSGMFYALDGANGTTKWSYPFSGGLSAAAIDARGCVYVGNWNSTLYCFAPPAPTLASISPARGTQGQTLTTVITGTNFFGRPTVSFSTAGITVNSVTVNSLTKLTVNITIADSCSPGFSNVVVTTGGGTSTLINGFRVISKPIEPNNSLSHQGQDQDSYAGSSSIPSSPQPAVQLPNITVLAASLSTAKVSQGTPVTVTANVVNRSTVPGSTRLTLFVNGQEESSQGISVNGGSTMSATFTITRNEPGTYTVYVGGTSAGSFTVDQFAPETIPLISGAMILFALIGCVIYMTRSKAVR